MIQLPYIEPVFRPPSEAHSLIVHVTNGCSWNRCTFCDLYTLPQKKFSLKPLDTIEQEITSVARSGRPVRRVVRAAGDARTPASRRRHDLRDDIRRHLPDMPRVST